MSYNRRSGPSPVLIVIVGAFIVFGGYYVWTGFLRFLEDQGNITVQVTRQAISTATAGVRDTRPSFPTAFRPATFTPLPPCQMFVVNVDRAVYRECPQQDNRECPVIDIVTSGTEFCVYSRVPNNPEWYVIELNPGGAYRDLVYMHESVLEAKNPTPTPTQTFTPRPTVSPLPTLSPTPTIPVTPTDTPLPVTPSVTVPPSVTASGPTPTPPRITIRHIP